MHLQDLLAADDIRIRHHHLAVETAGTQQRGIEHVGTVGRRDQDHAFIGFEAVHLDQQLVERLFTLVIAAAKARTAMAADRVDFVDEDDAGRVLLGLLEHVAHAAGADATNISTKSEPEIVKNGTLASPATARAINVLPVPGGPTSSTPRGNPPAEALEFFRDRAGTRRSPADPAWPRRHRRRLRTWTRPCASVSILARDLPKPIALPAPPCICRDRKIHTPISAMNGSQGNEQRDEPRHVSARRLRGDLHLAVIETLHQRRVRSARRSGTRSRLVRVPWISGPWITTSRTLTLVDLAQQLRERDVLRGGALTGDSGTA